MDLKQIKELIVAMERAGIKKLSIKQKSGDELHLERQDENPPAPQSTSPAAFYPPVYSHPSMYAKEHEPIPRQGRQAHEDSSNESKVKEEPAGRFVTSPLVGTFYTAASPDDPPFVKVGDRITEGTVICIIEAMKVMNEVKAGMSGTVAEILIDNAHPVEFGTKLIRIV